MMNMLKSLRSHDADNQEARRLYWLSGGLACLGCTMMTVSLVGLILA